MPTPRPAASHSAQATKKSAGKTETDKRGALKSMTGYAESRAAEQGWHLRVAIRSVNHRFLDLHVRVPEGFEQFEPGIRQAVRRHVRRGHLDLVLHCEFAGAGAIGVNREIAGSYLDAVNSLREQFHVKTEPDLAAILRLPGVIGPAAASFERAADRLASTLDGCLGEALERLDRMRTEEAGVLAAEMAERLRLIAAHSATIATLTEGARPAFAARLQARLRELLGEAPLDPARLAQEAALAAERADVAEELVRMRSHVEQFESLLAGAPDAGKKLDFLLQEMQRETNTLLSKTPGIEAEGLEITRLALEIKSEIERLREQVQNIE